MNKLVKFLSKILNNPVYQHPSLVDSFNEFKELLTLARPKLAAKFPNEMGEYDKLIGYKPESSPSEDSGAQSPPAEGPTSQTSTQDIRAEVKSAMEAGDRNKLKEIADSLGVEYPKTASKKTLRKRILDRLFENDQSDAFARSMGKSPPPKEEQPKVEVDEQKEETGEPEISESVEEVPYKKQTDLPDEILDLLRPEEGGLETLGATESEVSQIEKLKELRKNLQEQLKADPKDRKLKYQLQKVTSGIHGWESMIRKRSEGLDVSFFNPDAPHEFFDVTPENEDEDEDLTSEIADKIFQDLGKDPLEEVAKKFVTKFLEERSASPRLKKVLETMSKAKESGNLYNFLSGRITDITDSGYYDIVDKLVSEGKILSEDQKNIPDLIYQEMLKNPSFVKRIFRTISGLESFEIEENEPKNVLDTSDWVPIQTNPEFRRGIAEKLVGYYQDNFPGEIGEISDKLISRVESIIDTESFKDELRDMEDAGGLSSYVDVQVSEGKKEESIPRLKRDKKTKNYKRDPKDYEKFVQERTEEEGVPVERLRSTDVEEEAPTRTKVLKDVEGAVDSVWAYIQDSPDFESFLDYVEQANETEERDMDLSSKEVFRDVKREKGPKIQPSDWDKMYNKQLSLKDFKENLKKDPFYEDLDFDSPKEKKEPKIKRSPSEKSKEEKIEEKPQKNKPKKEGTGKFGLFNDKGLIDYYPSYEEAMEELNSFVEGGERANKFYIEEIENDSSVDSGEDGDSKKEDNQTPSEELENSEEDDFDREFGVFDGDTLLDVFPSLDDALNGVDFYMEQSENPEEVYARELTDEDLENDSSVDPEEDDDSDDSEPEETETKKSASKKKSSSKKKSASYDTEYYSLKDMNGFNCKQIKIWASEINSLGTQRVAVKVEWDKDSAEGVYPWNISHAIRTYIHSLEAANYVQDENLGLIGHPRIVDFDLDKCSAKVIVASTNASSFPSALVEGSAAVERRIKI